MGNGSMGTLPENSTYDIDRNVKLALTVLEVAVCIKR